MQGTFGVLECCRAPIAKESRFGARVVPPRSHALARAGCCQWECGLHRATLELTVTDVVGSGTRQGRAEVPMPVCSAPPCAAPWLQIQPLGFSSCQTSVCTGALRPQRLCSQRAGLGPGLCHRHMRRKKGRFGSSLHRASLTCQEDPVIIPTFQVAKVRLCRGRLLAHHHQKWRLRQAPGPRAGARLCNLPLMGPSCFPWSQVLKSHLILRRVQMPLFNTLEDRTLWRGKEVPGSVSRC